MTHYYNLTSYESRDLNNLISDHKSFNGFTPVPLNFIDHIVEREHHYGYNRMFIFGIWLLLGAFLPLWILTCIPIILLNLSSDLTGLSMLLCISLGIPLNIMYEYSCDKIDYNYLISKNQQLNLFNDFGIEYIC